MRSRPLLYSASLFLLGLAYRATFLSQGFSATDEGWLQSLGRRMAEGQVPYRDFYFVLPPVSLYREASLIKIFGDGYGLLASRWAFAVEATLASVVAFLILRRFVSDHLAFLTTLPTIFFSVIFYYFSNYTYDAILLTLAAMASLVYASRAPRTLSAIAGGAAALAFLAKPTFLVFLVALPLAGIATRRLLPADTRPDREDVDWRWFLLGFVAIGAAVAADLAIMHALGQFLYQAFALTRQAFPTSTSFLLAQDLPERLLAWPVWAALLGLLILILIPSRRPTDLVRLPLIGVLLGYFVVRVLRQPGYGPPTSRQELVVVLGLGLLLILNGLALVASVMGHGRWFSDHPLLESLRMELPPPILPFYALALQYVTQLNYSGLRYSYMGTYLSLPVGLLFLRALVRAQGKDRVTGQAAAALAAIVGAWFIAGGAVVTRGTVYRDANRAQLTATFQTGRMAGISTRPENVKRIDDLVAAVDRYSARNGRILVFPDLPVMYFLTHRTNPTRIDWYDPGEIIPSMTAEAVADLQRDPPRLVLMQTHDEADFLQAGPLLDYMAEPKWQPVYLWVKANYHQVAMIDGVMVLVPNPRA